MKVVDVVQEKGLLAGDLLDRPKRSTWAAGEGKDGKMAATVRR